MLELLLALQLAALPTRGADLVVLGTVVGTTASYETNAYGDRLIITHATVRVDDTWKGAGPVTIAVDIEGGTVGTITLHVSDVEPVVVGDTAVFFLKKHGAKYELHGRGHGLRKLRPGERTNGQAVADMKRRVQGR